MSIKKLGAIGAVIVVVVVAGFVLLGGDDETQPVETDGAFITEMVPHHLSAIDMAKIAEQRAEHPEIEQLAQNIIATQAQEVEELNSIHQRLYGTPVEGADHGTLGLPADEMGMSMDNSMLKTAEPFDQAFIDMMIPHHQGAIRMARIELTDGSDVQAQELATAIIEAQSSEIEQMNSWREKWYGAPSPAGGIPEETTG